MPDLPGLIFGWRIIANAFIEAAISNEKSDYRKDFEAQSLVLANDRLTGSNHQPLRTM